MTQTKLLMSLMASASLLAACGGGGDEAETETAATEVATEEMREIQVPDLPADPRIAENREKSDAYLAEMRAKDGVRALDNGILIETVSEGDGPSPTAEDYVSLHYTISVIGEEVMRDSREEEQPVTVTSFNQLPMPGLPQALPEMKEGETAKIIVPPEEAYGEAGVDGVFEPNETLIFEVELLEVVPPTNETRRAELDEARAQAQEEARLAALSEARDVFNNQVNAFKTEEGTQTAAPGVYYKVSEGQGEAGISDETVAFLQINKIIIDDETLLTRSPMRQAREEIRIPSESVPNLAALEEYGLPGLSSALTGLKQGGSIQYLLIPEDAGTDLPTVIGEASEDEVVDLQFLVSDIWSEEEVAEANAALEQSLAFIEEQAARDGVVQTGSGLAYEVLEEGESDVSPDPWDVVRVHYHGTLPNGEVFDSSLDRGEPISFPLNRVIAGWTEGVALMNVGDKYKFYIPPALAYGEQGTGAAIGRNEALVFEVELLGVEERDAPEGAGQ